MTDRDLAVAARDALAHMENRPELRPAVLRALESLRPPADAGAAHKAWRRLGEMSGALSSARTGSRNRARRLGTLLALLA
ncbi:MAG TPA: hypothetical protein VIJ77_00090 [Candidatus Tumulicola sp.]